MKARELMTSNPECITGEDTIQRAAQIMRDSDIGAVPVVESRESMRLVGVITDRDITIRHVAEGHSNNAMHVREHMSADVRSVGPDADENEVLQTMKDAKVRRVPVVDGDRIVGMIAQADIATNRRVGDKAVGETVEQISKGSSQK